MSRSADYTIGWITSDLTAAADVLDEEYDERPAYTRSQFDCNYYIFGRIGDRNVAMTCLPIGTPVSVEVSHAAFEMTRHFPNASLVFVGTGSSIQIQNTEYDVRLGDVVVGVHPAGPGVVQRDFGGEIDNERPLAQLPAEDLLQAVKLYKDPRQGLAGKLEDTVVSALPRRKRPLKRPDPDLDRLYKSDAVHSCGCQKCRDESVLMPREPRDDNQLKVHYGVIASGNVEIQNSSLRDKLAEAHPDVLCIEQLAGGVVFQYPCLVVCGISDYADWHSDKMIAQWGRYAALRASAYVKVLLGPVNPQEDQHKDAQALQEDERDDFVHISGDNQEQARNGRGGWR